MALEFRLKCDKEVLKHLCTTTFLYWMCHLEDFRFHCRWSNSLCAIFPVHLDQYNILHKLFDTQLDRIVEHLVIFHLHHSHGCKLEVNGKCQMSPILINRPSSRLAVISLSLISLTS